MTFPRSARKLREARLQKTHVIGPHSGHDILETAKPQRWKTAGWLPGSKVWRWHWLQCDCREVLGWQKVGDQLFIIVCPRLFWFYNWNACVSGICLTSRHIRVVGDSQWSILHATKLVHTWLYAFVTTHKLDINKNESVWKIFRNSTNMSWFLGHNAGSDKWIYVRNEENLEFPRSLVKDLALSLPRWEGLIPGQGISSCPRCGKKKKRESMSKNEEKICRVLRYTW